MFDKGQDRKRKFSEKSGDHSNVRDPRFKKVRKDKSGNDGIGGGRPKFKVALNQKSNFGQGQNRKSNFGGPGQNRKPPIGRRYTSSPRIREDKDDVHEKNVELIYENIKGGLPPQINSH